MKAVLALLLLAALPSSQALVFESSDDKVYPVTKVIKLLKDMGKQLEAEGEEDEDAYDKMACWCETNDKSKTKAIADYQSKVMELQTIVESSAAQSGRFNAEIKAQSADLETSNAALDQATSIRQKASNEFHSEEKDLLQSIKALDSAIVVLSKHHETALLDKSTLHSVTEVMRTAMTKHQALLQGEITPHARKLVLAQAQPYAPQSGEIFGILKQMKETFETNLQESQKQEGGDETVYDHLKMAKVSEINAITEAVQEKQQQLAEADERNAQAKEDLQDTNNALTADNEFLDDLKTRCAENDQEYQQRTALRQKEVTAIAEAISILSSDQAHETFSKTFNPSLLQTSKKEESARRAAAAELLQSVAQKVHNPKLAALASKTRLDPFAQVKLAIDQMVKELEQAKKDDFTERDTCISQINRNQLDSQENNHQKMTITGKLTGLQSTAEEQQSEIDSMTEQVADNKLQVKRAGEDRDKAHRAFQATLKDQRETQALLKKAIAVLKAVYKSHEAPKVVLAAQKSKVSQKAFDKQAPPAGFKTFTTEKAGAGVLAMLNQIVADAANMEKDTVKADEQEQADYEKFVEDTTKANEDLQRSLIDKNDDKSNTDQAVAEAKIDLRNVDIEAESLANNGAALHQGCDFLIQNFDMRQTAFTQEVDALKQAKALLSGMKFA